MLLPIAMGAACFGALYLMNKDESEDDYGAVSLRMGGRGPGAGKGVASWLGGRSYDGPYEYSSPSSVITNWSTFDVFGAESVLDERMGAIDDFFRLHFTPEGRKERLSGKVDAATAKLEELSEEAKGVSEPSELESIAMKMARLEQNIDKWNSKISRIGSSSFGALSGPEQRLMLQASELADEMAAAARAMAVASSPKKKAAATVKFIASYDAICALVPPAMRARISDESKKLLSQKMGAASAAFGAMGIDDADAVRRWTMQFGTIQDAVQAAEFQYDETDDLDDEFDDEFDDDLDDDFDDDFDDMA